MVPRLAFPQHSNIKIQHCSNIEIQHRNNIDLFDRVNNCIIMCIYYIIYKLI